MQFNSKTHHFCHRSNLYFPSSKYLKSNNTTGFLFCLITWDNTEPKTPNILTEFLSSKPFWSCVYTTYSDLVLAILRKVFVFQILWICNSLFWHHYYLGKQKFVFRVDQLWNQSWPELRSVCKKRFQIHYSNKFIVSPVKRKKRKNRNFREKCCLNND